MFLIHKFAFGQLGWTPQEYYTSSPYEFFAACEGYFDKQDEVSRIARLQTFYTVLAMGGKVRRPEELWKIWSDGKVSTSTKIVADGDIWEQIKLTHNIK